MVWGAISFDSRTPLVVIPGTLTAQRSPDISPIEHIWNVMERRLHPSRNVDYLARQLETIWQEIPQHTIRNLYQSMTRRVAACIQARDETWVYGYDPETKRQSSQWLEPGAPKLQKSKDDQIEA
ncbi:hypothetical protein LAZ67_9002712 [Cordylochernes scorpioides]|uniref:Transposase n=1 Tax=Cordylochernes scorpioides TaxID=51811 RepID=A0ABY6KU41_9ARAC|nr:hypothetical protein LAZ67_9002712 [Cordylochernes scorpioides]